MESFFDSQDCVFNGNCNSEVIPKDIYDFPTPIDANTLEPTEKDYPTVTTTNTNPLDQLKAWASANPAAAVVIGSGIAYLLFANKK